MPYDGILCRANRKLVQRAGQLSLPLVNVWLASPAWREAPGVFPDCAAAGRLRAEHLLARGLRRFAVLASNTRGPRIESAAFAAAVREAGFPCLAVKLPVRSTKTYSWWEEHERRIGRFMRQWQPPIGVFASSGDTGRMVAQMCHQRGWRVPHDVAIIAGMNNEPACEHPRPSLTSVEMDFQGIGYESARLLDRLMDGQPPPDEPILVPPRNLVVRESTDFVAVDDAETAAAMEFIAANSHRPISPDDVAGAAGIGLRSLQRRFREHLGQPISEEIQRVRIERAKRELAQSKRPIYQIARDVGFGRAMRMYEAFRRELGVSPREYRKKQRTEQET